MMDKENSNMQKFLGSSTRPSLACTIDCEIAENEKRLTDIELTDRFGDTPHGVRALIDIAPSLTHLRVHGDVHFPEDLKAYAEAKLTTFHAEIGYSDTAFRDHKLFTTIPALQRKGF